MKISLGIFILFLFILPVISADIIMPGYHGVDIINYITNINDFPEYAFISSGSLGPGMCPIKIINEAGKIEDYYKFCDVSVYAVKKDKLNISKITKINSDDSMEISDVLEYLSSIEAKEVLNDISTYTEVPDINPEIERTNYFSVDLQQVKAEPNSTSKGNNYLIYVYLAVSLIALATIIFLIIRKFKKKKK